MPGTNFRRFCVAVLLALTLTTSAVADPLGAGAYRTPGHQHWMGLWTFFVHLIGASGGTFDPNGGRK
jgi:hypothetical protein